MKCQKCGSEWNSKVKSIDCPFCGEKLEPEVNSDFTNISEVLKYIVDTYGIEVYKNTSLLLAYISDLAPRLETEKRLLKICAQSGVVTQFAENSNITIDEQEIFLKKSEATLCNQYFLNKDATENVLSWLSYSLSWSLRDDNNCKNIKETNILNETVPENIEGNQNVAELCGEHHTDRFKKDRTVAIIGNNKELNSSRIWKNIVDISAGYMHTVGLKSDGTAIATGENYMGRCEVSRLGNDLIAVVVSSNQTFGLKSDGTIRSVGECGMFGLRDHVELWKDIIRISPGISHIVGLKSDGTVIATGRNNVGQCNVSNWEDIIDVSAGSEFTVGLKFNGGVIMAGIINDKSYDLSNWKDIIRISAGVGHIVGLKSDGTVIAVGDNRFGQCNVSNWKDITSISSGDYYTIGLKLDGTVIAVGDNKYEQCNILSWSGIVKISAGSRHTVGLKSDGTLIATGWNDDGQCNVNM